MDINNKEIQFKVYDPKKDEEWWNKFLEDYPPDGIYITYKDYRGHIFKVENGYRGKLLDIPDHVNFERDTFMQCREEFFKAVDDYIQTKNKLSNNNMEMS